MDTAGLWMAYFWLAVVVFGGSAVVRPVMYFAKPGLFTAYDAVISLCGIPVLVALWGYIHSEPYLWRWLWQALFVVVLVENIRFFFTSNFRATVKQLGVRKSWATFGVVSALSVPMFVAHGIYAFGSSRLWE